MSTEYPKPDYEMTPARKHFLITPSNTAVLTRHKAIYCAVGGDVVIEDSEGTTLVYTLLAGDVLPFRPYRIRVSDGSTSTSATLYGWE